jgi:glycosyltransferase involved in cell wall biosynthesis
VKPSVLLVSKPVVPPWSDSSKNLVRDLVLGTEEVELIVLTDGSHGFRRPNVRERAVYASAGELHPTLRQNARVVGALVRERCDLQHYFFAPNRRTSTVARWLGRAHRRPMIHTICSVPRSFSGVRAALFADLNVALSHYTRDRLVEAGITNVRYVPPSISPLIPRRDPSDVAACRRHFGLDDERPVVLFPGDYSFSGAAQCVADAASACGDAAGAPTWVFACRLKDEDSRRVEARIQEQLEPLSVDGRARFMNHVDAIHDLVVAADLVVLPAASTYAKMDLPLVLIEAMALGRPVIVPDGPPMSQLVADGGGIGIPAEDSRALADAVMDLLRDDSARARLSDEAIAAAMCYSRDRVAAEYVALYRELLGRRP